MTSMEVARADSEVIYNGPMTWRRLRGVKINPIYQENDNSRNGDGADTQSDTSILVGEIQIEMYESLPRHRMVRQSRSTPVFPDGRPTYVPHVPFTFNSQKFHPENELPDEASHSSNVSPHVPVDENKNDTLEAENDELGIPELSPDKNGNVKVEQVLMSEREHRKQLTRQSGIDATSDDPDAIEIADNTSPASGSSSPSLISYSSPPKQVSKMQRRGTPRFKKPRNYTRNRQLSAVQEQSSINENELEPEVNDEEFDPADLAGDDSDCIVHSDHDATDISCLKEMDKLHTNEETCLTNCRNVKYDSCNIILSTKNVDNSSVIYSFNKYDVNVNSSILSPEDEIIPLSQRKAIYPLDKIAMLPSYSHIHNTSPVGSVDYINNNHETVPDLMLQHNRHINGVSGNDRINGFVKHRSGNNKKEYIMWDTQDLTVMYSLSNTSPIDSDNKSLVKDRSIINCDCGGRPTLKCACGRKALQKLLGEKYTMKHNEDDYFDNKYKPVLEETTSDSCIKTPAMCCNQYDIPQFNNSPSKHSVSDIYDEITEFPTEDPPEKKPQPLKPILHSSLTPKRSVSTLERRGVSFSQDTLFNEDKGAVYLKECISPSDLALLISELRDDDEGLDNPAFGELKEEESEENDSKVKKKSKKNSKSKKTVASTDSIILKVSELNTPAYMQTYLSGCDGIRTPPDSTSKKAPPVSIEAIGGTIIDDPEYSEIGLACDDDFEEYRRRRKFKYDENENVDEWMKKSSRRKKIKICVIIVSIISLIIIGIALAIHFGAPHAGSLGGGLPSQTHGGGVPGFPVF